MPRYLNEFSQDELAAELERRTNLRSHGFCDRCGLRHGALPVCDHPNRHSGEYAHSHNRVLLMWLKPLVSTLEGMQAWSR